LNGAPERGEPGGNVSAEMDTQDATTMFGQNCKIGARLRCLDNTKGVFLARHRQIDRIVAGDLKKHTSIRAAFVDLAGRMKKPRTKTEAGCDSPAVAD
jgi:hypothetical protein